jgi:hypothetical protein
MEVGTMRTLGTGLLLLAMAGMARAEIYVCEDNGKKTFSQQPCGANAKAVELQSDRSRITLPEEFDAKAAYDMCKIIVRSWDMAAQMRRQRVSIDRAYPRVFAYLRESVSNFDEFSRTNPGLFTAFQDASRTVTQGAYSNPDLQPGEREVAHRECTNAIVKNLDGGKQKRGGKSASTTM